MTTIETDKRKDLAGPGIGTYEEVEAVLPTDYEAMLSPRETMVALYDVKRLIEDLLCERLGLTLVQVPLIVESASGVNDYLDRDGSRTPVRFRIANDGLHSLDAEVVQAATKWKRLALRQFGMSPGEGILTDMRAVRKDYFLDHDHSAYVDQWDWEKAIEPAQRTLAYLAETVRAIWSVLVDADTHLRERWPALSDSPLPALPSELEFFHAEDVLAMYPERRESSARRCSCRNTRRSSSTGSAGHSQTGCRTSSEQPTTTTGRRRRSRPTEGRCTD